MLIKKFLQDNGIKQYHLARVSKIAESKLNLMLKEKRHIKPEEYEVICWALGVGVDKFLAPHKPIAKE
jgi:DNA-binding Xre family transcriptional regulator